VIEEFRVFHALRKGASIQEALSFKTEIREALRRVVPTLNVRLGGWDAWEHDVATGVRYSDRAPRFHAFVITETTFGKATASILRQALTAGKLVLFYDPQAVTISRVGEVITVDESNWKTGWSASLQ
jgi:hypothetical protein